MKHKSFLTTKNKLKTSWENTDSNNRDIINQESTNISINNQVVATIPINQIFTNFNDFSTGWQNPDVTEAGGIIGILKKTWEVSFMSFREEWIPSIRSEILLRYGQGEKSSVDTFDVPRNPNIRRQEIFHIQNIQNSDLKNIFLKKSIHITKPSGIDTIPFYQVQLYVQVIPQNIYR